MTAIFEIASSLILRGVAIAAAAATLATAAYAKDTRVITDDTGVEVEIPVKPELVPDFRTVC